MRNQLLAIFGATLLAFASNADDWDFGDDSDSDDMPSLSDFGSDDEEADDYLDSDLTLSYRAPTYAAPSYTPRYTPPSYNVPRSTPRYTAPASPPSWKPTPPPRSTYSPPTYRTPAPTYRAPTYQAPRSQAPTYTPPLPRSYTKTDPESGNQYRVREQSNGDTKIDGYNYNTGSQWNTTIKPNGNMRGQDANGNSWDYNNRSKTYYNYGTGQMCTGEGPTRVCSGGR